MTIRKPALLTHCWDGCKHLLTLLPWEKHTSIKVAVVLSKDNVVARDGLPQPFITLLKLYFHRKYIKHPKHIQDIQLNTSDMLAATHIELSHTNSNIFATFNEWINLAEQKKCSKKGPIREQLLHKKKKKVSAEDPLPSCPRTVLFRHALCYYNLGTLFPFLHFYNAQQWTRGILLYPQISTSNPAPYLLPTMILIQRQKENFSAAISIILYAFQPTKQVHNNARQHFDSHSSHP